jgi:uncharacterized protein (TIGR02271 family)
MTADRPPPDPAGTTDQAVEVVRSEEQLRVGTSTRVRERVRLRKRVVSEEVTRTVTVAREVLDVERLPADATEPWEYGGNGLAPAADLDIVLHEERVTVTTVVVPVERVRVRVERITDQVAVAEVLRREEIDVVTDTEQTR